MASSPKPVIFVSTLGNENPLVKLPLVLENEMRDDFDLISSAKLAKNPDRGESVVGAVVYPFVDDKATLEQKFRRMPNLSAVSIPMAGIDFLPLEYMRSKSVKLGRAPGGGFQSKSVADHAMLLMLAFNRNFVEDVDYVKKYPGQLFNVTNLGHDLTNGVIGIIGMGKIGLEVAKRAEAASMKVLYHNRHKREDIGHVNAAYCATVAELLRESDYVMISCPLTQQTHHMIGEQELQLMKKSALIVNVSRGAIIQTDALVKALQEGWIRGAALDVTDPEPLPPQHPLRTLHNVLISPHAASKTIGARLECSRAAVDNIRAVVLEGKDRMPCQVDY